MTEDIWIAILVVVIMVFFLILPQRASSCNYDPCYEGAVYLSAGGARDE